MVAVEQVAVLILNDWDQNAPASDRLAQGGLASRAGKGLVPLVEPMTSDQSHRGAGRICAALEVNDGKVRHHAYQYSTPARQKNPAPR